MRKKITFHNVICALVVGLFIFHTNNSNALHLAADIADKAICKLLSNQEDANEEIENNVGETPKEIWDSITYIHNLIMLIDHNKEFDKPEKAVSSTLSTILYQEASPALIFGKHLLDNVVEKLDLSKWFLFEFSYQELGSYLLIPKNYARQKLGEEKIEKFKSDDYKNFLKLGFNVEQMNLKAITNKSNIQKMNFKKVNFSELVPQAIDKLLTKSKRYVYVVGHGLSIADKKQSTIVNLYIKDAIELFDVLEKKDTQLVYVLTCFFGGKNLAIIQDWLNANNKSRKEEYFSSRMTVVSAATTEVRVRYPFLPPSYKKFFKEYRKYFRKKEKLKSLLLKRIKSTEIEKAAMRIIREKIKKTLQKIKISKEIEKVEGWWWKKHVYPTYSVKSSEIGRLEKRLKILQENLSKIKGTDKKKEIKKITMEIGSLKAERDYFAKHLLPALTNPVAFLSNFPQIRFPVQDAKFYSVAIENQLQVIDKIALGKAQLEVEDGKVKLKPKSIKVTDKRIVVVNVANVNIPINIENQIPLLITAYNNSVNTFDEINIGSDIENCGFTKFIYYAIAGEVDFFKESPLENCFKIQKLNLTKKEDVKIEGKTVKLPKTLNGVIIQRGPAETLYSRFKIGDKLYYHIYENYKHKFTMQPSNKKEK